MSCNPWPHAQLAHNHHLKDRLWALAAFAKKPHCISFVDCVSVAAACCTWLWSGFPGSHLQLYAGNSRSHCRGSPWPPTGTVSREGPLRGRGAAVRGAGGAQGRSWTTGTHSWGWAPTGWCGGTSGRGKGWCRTPSPPPPSWATPAARTTPATQTSPAWLPLVPAAPSPLFEEFDFFMINTVP